MTTITIRIVATITIATITTTVRTVATTGRNRGSRCVGSKVKRISAGVY